MMEHREQQVLLLRVNIRNKSVRLGALQAHVVQHESKAGTKKITLGPLLKN